MENTTNDELLKKKCLFPIVIKNDFLDSVMLTEKIELRPITSAEREEFFGLADYEFDYCFPNNIPGFCAPRNLKPSKSTKGRYNYKGIIQQGMISGISDILASRHVVVVEIGEPYSTIFNLDLAFKLLRPTSTGTCIRFTEGDTDVGFSRNMPLCGPCDYLTLNDEDIKAIGDILNRLNKLTKDDSVAIKWTLLSSLYVRALEGGPRIEIDLRFMLLMIALEALYVDKTQELSFRLCITASNILAKAKGYDAHDAYKKIKYLYGIRSKIVHKGHTEKLGAEEFSLAIEFVRESLNLYLENPQLFAPTNLVSANLMNHG